MASLATIATIATIGSAVVGAGAAVYSGYQQKQAADQTAQALHAQGLNEMAATQRTAEQQRLEGKLLMSAQQAQAAASGGGAGADAPTIVRLMGETAKQTEFAAQSSNYQGEAMRSRYDQSAESARAGGANSFLGGFLGGAGRLISGAGSYAQVRKEFPI